MRSKKNEIFVHSRDRFSFFFFLLVGWQFAYICSQLINDSRVSTENRWHRQARKRSLQSTLFCRSNQTLSVKIMQIWARRKLLILLTTLNKFPLMEPQSMVMIIAQLLPRLTQARCQKEGIFDNKEFVSFSFSLRQQQNFLLIHFHANYSARHH